ncbi:putative IgGFc-binding protein-like, partial [Apostichopus japonicus]
QTVIPTCPTNTIYGTCSCKATCDDPNGQSGCNRDCLGSEGCTCPDGFLMQGSSISASECGCFVAEANLVIPDVYDAGQRQDGVYTIMPTGWPNPAFNVHCKMENGGGWTRNYKLRFDITTSSGSAKYAEYPEFQIESESNNYRMNKLADRSSGNTEENNSARMTETMTHVVTSTVQRSTEAAGGTQILGALIVIVIAIAIISNTAAAASHFVLMTTSTVSTMEATGK